MRLCLSEIEDVVEWDSTARYFKEGHGYKIYELYFQRFIYGLGNNWTMMTTTSNQDCLEAIQSNETDLVVSMVHFPLHPNLTNIRHGQVGGTFTTVITSFYDTRVPSGEDVDIVDTFNSFPPEIWTLILIMLSIIGGLMLASFMVRSSFSITKTKKNRLFLNREGVLQVMRFRNQRKKRQRMKAVYIRETTDMLWKGLLNKDDSLSDPLSRKGQPWSRAILRVFLCFFLIWTVFFFTSMVQTELVTVRRPETINSYKDILKKKDLMPCFIQSTTDYLSFMEASKNSDEGKIWTRIANQDGGYRESLMKGEQFVLGLDQMFNNEKILIATREGGFIIRSFSCKMKSILERAAPENQRYHSLRCWTKEDPSAVSVLRGHVFNTGFQDRGAEDRLRSSWEFGLEQYVFATVELDILTSPKLKVYDDTSPLDEKKDCLGDTVQKPWPKFNQPSIVNYRKLFFYELFMGLGIAFATLILELSIRVIKKSVQENWTKKNRCSTLSSQQRLGAQL